MFPDNGFALKVKGMDGSFLARHGHLWVRSRAGDNALEPTAVARLGSEPWSLPAPLVT